MKYLLNSLSFRSFLKYCGFGFILTASFIVEAKTPREGPEEYREAKLEAKAELKRSRVLPESTFEPKIIGGDDATPNAYPWMAAILDRGESDPVFAQFCGGSLIHPYWVLTAGHCVQGALPEYLDVLIGAPDLGNAGQGERIEVVEIIVHPDFDVFSRDGDAALLRLATPSSAPVLRVNSDTLLEMPGLLATILGWGALDPQRSSYPEVLQEAQVPLVDFATANAIYDNELTPNMIAAGNLSEGGVDACSEDSGGPLLVRDFDGEWTLAGLTSFGDGCAQPYAPGIYTRVSRIRPWLLDILSPKYAAWEEFNAVLGESRDADGDLKTNFEEFAFATDPMLPDASLVGVEMDPVGPVFTFRRPMGAGSELEHRLLYRADLSDIPTELSLDGQFLESIPEGNEEIIRGAFPSGNRGFISVESERPATLAHAVRPVAFPGRTTSMIDPSFQVDSFGRFFQEFTFSEQPLGEPIRYLAVSDSFDVVLELYDATGTTLLAAADSNSASGNGERLLYTATSVPIVRVVSGDGSVGPFSLSAYTDLASIGPGETISDSLSTSDEFDEFFFARYYKRDYFLDLPDSSTGLVSISLSSIEFDPYLILYDASNGEFIAENDDIDFDSGNLNSRIVVDTAMHREVLIQVTTAIELETGAFTLVVD
jgi:hypothetical protein